MASNMPNGPWHSPFLKDLGVKVVSWDAGVCELSLDVASRHLNVMSLLQGGVIATLLDTACGYAGVIIEPGGRPTAAVTVSLAISYLSKVAAGQVNARGVVSHAGKSLFFADGTLATEDGRLVAKAQGAFKRVQLAG